MLERAIGALTAEQPQAADKQSTDPPTDMGYNARVLADSLPHEGESRLTTLEVTMPRFVLAEFNTHRVFSRNSASSRAIPLNKQIQRIKDNPFIPIHWGANQPGMQAFEEATSDLIVPRNSGKRYSAYTVSREEAWLELRDEAIKIVEAYDKAGYHKQIPARLLEPWMWHTVIVSSTEWENFFKLRCPNLHSPTFNSEKLYDPHFPAQPEIQIAAVMMSGEMAASTPKVLEQGEWHLPLWGMEGDTAEMSYEQMDVGAAEHLPVNVLLSVGRCARVSYLTHDGVRDPEKDIELALSLTKNGHWSPWEHAARNDYATTVDEIATSMELRSNFAYPWTQARKLFQYESGTTQ